LGEFGTSFLVDRKIDEVHSRIFIVTNKHLLHKDPEGRKEATEINFWMLKKVQQS